VYTGASNDLVAQAYTPFILSQRLETPNVFDDNQSFERPASVTDTTLPTLTTISMTAVGKSAYKVRINARGR
jgi:hypothetical protein